MLSLETERQLARLIFQLLNSEKEVEVSRQELCRQEDFDPSAAYSLLDKNGLRKLSVVSIRNFLSQSGSTFSLPDVSLLISQYDSNGDFCLSREDFFQLVLPSEDFRLRELSMLRDIGSLSSVTEMLLARHLKLEIANQIQLKSLKTALMSRPDYSHSKAYESINQEGLPAIRGYQIESLLRRKGFPLSLNDLDAIIRRIDTDGDEMLNMSEFVEFLTIKQQRENKKQSLHRKSSLAVAKKSGLAKTKSAKTLTGKKSYERISTGKLPRASLGKSSKEGVSIGRQSRNTQSSGKLSMVSSHGRNSQIGSFLDSKSGKQVKDRISRKESEKSLKKNAVANLFDHSRKEIAELFRAQIDLDRRYESSKEMLAKQSDFSVLDFYRLVDLKEKGWITPADLNGFFKDLGLSHTEDDIYLIFRHFSSDSTLRYKECEKIVTPRNPYHAEILGNRRPLAFPPLDRMAAFTSVTINAISDVLATLVNCERAAEGARKVLNGKALINVLDIFNGIDRDHDGFISMQELVQILKKIAVAADDKDAEGLMERYDKDCDGKISYPEFLQELTPKI